MKHLVFVNRQTVAHTEQWFRVQSQNFARNIFVTVLNGEIFCTRISLRLYLKLLRSCEGH